MATFRVWAKTCRYWVCCFKCKWAVAPEEEEGASRAQAPALAVLAFANKHSTISTSLLSLQKTCCFKVNHLIILYIIKSRLLITQHGGIKITTLVSCCHKLYKPRFWLWARQFQAIDSHWFHMQLLTATILFTIILIALKGSISGNRQRQW